MSSILDLEVFVRSADTGSLSAAARHITGTQWNGWRFFGLREIGRDKP